jgi:hypothetical protein
MTTVGEAAGEGAVPLSVTVAEGVEKGAAPPPTWRWRRVGERIEEGSGAVRAWTTWQGGGMVWLTEWML